MPNVLDVLGYYHAKLHEPIVPKPAIYGEANPQ